MSLPTVTVLLFYMLAVREIQSQCDSVYQPALESCCTFLNTITPPLSACCRSPSDSKCYCDPSKETNLACYQTTLPPAPTTLPPAPTTLPPAPTTLPPAPTTPPPAPTTLPPAPTTLPPAPTTLPPAPTTLPPAPTTLPPAPTTLPPAPTTLPPAPTTLPPAPTTLPPAPTTLPPAPTTTTPAPTTTTTAATTTTSAPKYQVDYTSCYIIIHVAGSFDKKTNKFVSDDRRIDVKKTDRENCNLSTNEPDRECWKTKNNEPACQERSSLKLYCRRLTGEIALIGSTKVQICNYSPYISIKVPSTGPVTSE